MLARVSEDIRKKKHIHYCSLTTEKEHVLASSFDELALLETALAVHDCLLKLERKAI